MGPTHHPLPFPFFVLLGLTYDLSSNRERSKGVEEGMRDESGGRAGAEGRGGVGTAHRRGGDNTREADDEWESLGKDA